MQRKSTKKPQTENTTGNTVSTMSLHHFADRVIAIAVLKQDETSISG